MVWRWSLNICDYAFVISQKSCRLSNEGGFVSARHPAFERAANRALDKERTTTWYLTSCEGLDPTYDWVESR